MVTLVPPSSSTPQPLRALSRGWRNGVSCAALGGYALLALACTRAEAGKPNPGEPATAASVSKSIAPAPPPLPVPAAAQAIPAALAVPAAPGAPVSEQERALYEIILRLARDPASQSELAPKARVRFAGSQRGKRPLKDAREELGWVVEAGIKLVAADAPPDPLEESSMSCWPDQLRCTISQPGGETNFFFARVGQPQRLVLREIKNAEP